MEPTIIKVRVEIKGGKIHLLEKGEGVDLLIVDHDTKVKKVDCSCIHYAPEQVIDADNQLSVTC